jgi:hypothetical protein
MGDLNYRLKPILVLVPDSVDCRFESNMTAVRDYFVADGVVLNH